MTAIPHTPTSPSLTTSNSPTTAVGAGSSHLSADVSIVSTVSIAGAHLRLADDGAVSDDFDVLMKHVYLIGIGGSGMSGLARMLKSRGAIVSGSDNAPGEATDALIAEKIAITFDQSKAWLPDACDLVIASAAVRADHPQMLEAQQRSVPTMLYAEALGKCMQGRTSICIAGTHGKSTTTAMTGCALTDAGLDPTVIVGATSPQLVKGTLHAGNEQSVGFRLGNAKIPAGTHAGDAGLLVAEACEYNRSFHNYRPTIGYIGSIEADHLDCYGTLEAVIESFHEFGKLLPDASAGGKLLIAHDGAHRREVTRGLNCEVHTIGFSPEADYVVHFDPATRAVALSHGRETIARWTNMIPGSHMAFNACAALVLATFAGADPLIAAKSLAHFRGVDRRMQLLGEKKVGAGLVRVFDDYGHHPTEVDCTLRALRESERPEDRGGRLICVFQPHQHSRTRHLLEEFANSFGHADIVLVPHIYFVRDSQEEKQKVTAGDLVDRLREKGVRAMHLYPFEAIVDHLQHTARAGDVVVAMGAGPVWQVAKGYLDA